MREFEIKPSHDELIVRDPITREKLKVNGETKPRNTYWLRRIQDGSAIEMVDKKKKGAKS